MAFLLVVDATILSDERDVLANVNDWAQDWLNCDGYAPARPAKVEQYQRFSNFCRSKNVP
jgi:hypothetical protein